MVFRISSIKAAVAALVFFVILLVLPGCTHLFYQPDRFLYYPPEKLGYKAVDVHFTAADGTKLFGWWFPAQDKSGALDPKPKGTIVQFHGNAENISSHYASLVWLTREGYNLFAFDYRGYGLSEGEASPEGVYLDGMAALDKAWELRKGRKFVVYGQSLGGAIAMRAFKDFRHQEQTSLVVLDSTFVSYQTVARRILASRWYTWILSPLPYLLVSDKYSAADALAQNKTPLLVIHDEHDPVVPFADGEDIFAMATSRKEFWRLDDGRHIAVFAPFHAANHERFLKLLRSL